MAKRWIRPRPCPPRQRIKFETLEQRRILTATGFYSQEVSCCGSELSALTSADLDGDGDVDAVAGFMDGTIEWYPNTDGQGTFGPGRPVASGGTAMLQMVSADLDGDGDNDLAAGSRLDSSIVWYENLNGAGTFGESQLITSVGPGHFSIVVGDIDGDNDQDLAWASHTSDSSAWRANDGTGSFGTPKLIAAAKADSRALHLADVDGDGDADAILVSGDFIEPDRIDWFENVDGSGLFGDAKLITDSIAGTWSIDVDDIDGDGDPDLAAASYLYDGGKLTWIENVNDGQQFEPHPISSPTGTTHNVRLADLDGDGDPSVVAFPVAGNIEGLIHDNLDGQGTFNGRATAPVSFNGANVFEVADLDGDGDTDLLTDVAETGRVVWHESRPLGDSNGDGRFTSSDFVTVFIAGKYETGQPASFAEGDWDGDGLFSTADLVAAFSSGTYSVAAQRAAIASAVEAAFADSD